MKTQFVKAAFALMIPALMLTSCEKSEDTTPVSSERKMTLQEITSTPQFVEAYNNLKEKFYAQNPDSRVEFIAPFFMGDGFGLSRDLVFDFSGPFPMVVDGESAFFASDLDGNDFYRQNNDGTVSVHVTSNRAYGEYADYGTGELLYSENGHLTMNYTGEVITLTFVDPVTGEVLATIHLVDISSNPSAISFHGNARVGENGNAPFQNLNSMWVCNPGWTQVNIDFSLN